VSTYFKTIDTVTQQPQWLRPVRALELLQPSNPTNPPVSFGLPGGNGAQWPVTDGVTIWGSLGFPFSQLTVRSCDMYGTNQVVMFTAPSFITSQMVQDSSNLYFGCSGGELYSLPKSGASPTLLLTAASGIKTISVDKSGISTYLVYTQFGNSEVRRILKAGGGDTLMHTGPGGSQIGVVMDSTDLYMSITNASPNAIKKLALTSPGGGTTTLVSGVSNLDVYSDLSTDYVFYHEGLGLSSPFEHIRRVPKAGGSVVTLASDQRWIRAGVQVFGDYIYWMESGIVTGFVKIKRCSIYDGCGFTTIHSHAGTLDPSPMGIAVASNGVTIGAAFFRSEDVVMGGAYGTDKADLALASTEVAATTKGQAVMFAGIGDHYKLAKADVLATADFAGVLVQDVASISWGYVRVSGLATIPAAVQAGSTAWVPGNKLWLDPSTSGKITKDKPTAPTQFVIPVGTVVRVNLTDATILIEKAKENLNGVVALTNASGGAITKGQATYLSAANSVALAEADGTAAAAQFVGGVADASIANTSTGYIQYADKLVVPTALQLGTAWTFGDKVYVSATAGSYSNAAPVTSGQYRIPVGRCLNTPAGGDAFVLIEKAEAEVVP